MGNHQRLQIRDWAELRLEHHIPFSWEVDTWYTMKLSVTVDEEQAIVRGILGVCAALSIEVIAEGVETEAELAFLREQNVHLFQGYLLARPAFEQVPDINWSAVAHG